MYRSAAFSLGCLSIESGSCLSVSRNREDREVRGLGAGVVATNVPVMGGDARVEQCRGRSRDCRTGKVLDIERGGRLISHGQWKNELKLLLKDLVN